MDASAVFAQDAVPASLTLFPLASPEPAAASNSATGLHGVCVVVCEEDPRIRRLLVHYLAYHGAQVLECDNGDAAFEQSCRANVDVVVASLEAPGGGLELAARLRQNVARAPVPMVVLSSAFLNTRQEREFQQAHAFPGVFRKPVPLRDLLVCLRHLVAPQGQQPAAGPTPAPQRARTTTQIRSVVLQGRNTVPALAAVAARIYQDQLSGVLEVRSQGQLRRVLLAHGLVVGTSSSVEDERLGALLLESGLINAEQAAAAQALMERTGVRFGHAVVEAAGIPASAVAQAVEEQTLWVAMTAFTRMQGTWELLPMGTNPVLATQLRLDPMEVVMRGCMDGVSQEEARVMLEELARDGRLFHTPSFLDRAAMFSILRPRSQLLALLTGVEDPQVAVARAATVQGGLNQLLALMLAGAYHVGQRPEDVPAQARASVFGALGGVWRAPGLPREVLDAREAIAREWLRSAGNTPQEVLGIPASAGAQQAREALEKFRTVFGAEMDSLNLGPARACLQVTRARMREAAALLGL